MNYRKTWIALAVGCACSAPALAAGSVQLYGTIDLGVTHFSGIGSDATTVSSTGLSSGVQSPSVIGIKGYEMLAPKLAAVFHMETGYCAAGTSQDLKTSGGASLSGGYCAGGGFMQSDTWVGLKGRLGMIAGGRSYAAMYRNEKAMDPFGAGTTGSVENLSLINQYQLARANQVLAYVTPAIDGFSGSLSYSFAPGAGGTVPQATPANATKVSRSQGIQVRYTGPRLVAGVAYAQVTNVRVLAFLNPQSGVNDGSLKGWQAYGAYDFGVARLSASYVQSAADYNSGHASSMLLGLKVPLGRSALLLSFNEAKTDYGMRNVNLIGVPLYGNARQYAVGWTYALSKRTNLYASYARISNDAHTAFAVGSATDFFVGSPGQGSSGTAVGLRHEF